MSQDLHNITNTKTAFFPFNGNRKTIKTFQIDFKPIGLDHGKLYHYCFSCVNGNNMYCSL